MLGDCLLFDLHNNDLDIFNGKILRKMIYLPWSGLQGLFHMMNSSQIIILIMIKRQIIQQINQKFRI
jgi:hypothetical protein